MREDGSQITIIKTQQEFQGFDVFLLRQIDKCIDCFEWNYPVSY